MKVSAQRCDREIGSPFSKGASFIRIECAVIGWADRGLYHPNGYSVSATGVLRELIEIDCAAPYEYGAT